MPRSPRYSDARYGVVRRNFFMGGPAGMKFDVNTVGTVAEYGLSLPRKAQIIEFGIMSAGSDVVLATDDTLELRTAAGAKLATFVGNGDLTIGTMKASSGPPETATSIARNAALRCCVGTNVGVSGSAIAFVDWVDDVDDTHAP